MKLIGKIIQHTG